MSWHPRLHFYFGDGLSGFHGVATTTAAPGPGLCCGSLFRFVSCVRAPLSVSPPAVGCFAARSPGGCASWPLAFALDALSTVHEMAAESLYMKWPLNHRRCVEYS